MDPSTGKRGKVQQGQISKSGSGITSNMELIKLDGHDLTKLSFEESIKLIKNVESEDSKHELVFGIPTELKTSEGVVGTDDAHYIRGNLTEAGRQAKEEEKRRKSEKKRLKQEKKALEKRDEEGVD